MGDQNKTKKQLIKELAKLRRRNAELEAYDTKHKGAEMMSRESEEKYYGLFDNSTDFIYILDLKGNFIEANRAAELLTGYSKSELIGMNYKEYIPPEHHEKIFKAFNRVFKTGKSLQDFPLEVVVKDGIKKFFETNIVLLRKEKEIIGFHGTSRDITERIQMENKLSHERDLIQTLFGNIPDFIYFKDSKARFCRASSSFFDLFGRSIEDIIGKTDLELFPEEIAKETYKEDLHVIKTGIPIINKEEGGEVIDGVETWVLTTKIPWVDKEGNIIGLLGISRDITERKKAEEGKKQLHTQLIQSAKMAGVGTLASGVAHEFNNLLQIMSGNVQFAQRSGKPEDMKEALDIVESTSGKALNIIKDLATFSRVGEAKKELCSIKEPLESVLSLIEDQLKKNNIGVMRKYGRTSQLRVNKGEMQQVFLNMVTNARDAMLPKKGRLEVGIRQDKGHVKVSFHDTGKGIKKEDLDRVFDPFYTTKGAVGGDARIAGTGLGLSVSYGIVKRHGGAIEVESQKGKGTTFTISLPVKRKRSRKKNKVR